MLKKINMKIEKIGKRQEFILIVFLAVFLVFGITVGIGTMTCGWHLVDDHEFMRYVYEMKYEGKTLIGLIDEWIKRDLSWRYEPLYYANRIISSALFGINSVSYMMLKSIEIVMSFVFLYYCARLMQTEKVYAFLFAAISLIGYQSPVWWKLGPQEAQCTLLFSIGFYCMLKWLRGWRSGWAWGSIVAFVLMSNYKESFIILIPFLMLFCLYCDVKWKNEKLSWKRAWHCIKSRAWYYLILGLLFCVLIMIIVIYVGVSDYDKVGLDAAVPWEEYQQALSNALAGDLKWFKRFGIVFGMILLTYWDNFKKLWKEMLLTAVFLLPQIILFGQAGIQERYILPSSIGYALFF